MHAAPHWLVGCEGRALRWGAYLVVLLVVQPHDLPADHGLQLAVVIVQRRHRHRVHTARGPRYAHLVGRKGQRAQRVAQHCGEHLGCDAQ